MKDGKKINPADREAQLFVTNQLLSQLKVIAKNSVDDPPKSRACADKIEELQAELEQVKKAA